MPLTLLLKLYNSLLIIALVSVISAIYFWIKLLARKRSRTQELNRLRLELIFACSVFIFSISSFIATRFLLQRGLESVEAKAMEEATKEAEMASLSQNYLLINKLLIHRAEIAKRNGETELSANLIAQAEEAKRKSEETTPFSEIGSYLASYQMSHSNTIQDNTIQEAELRGRLKGQAHGVGFNLPEALKRGQSFQVKLLLSTAKPLPKLLDELQSAAGIKTINQVPIGGNMQAVLTHSPEEILSVVDERGKDAPPQKISSNDTYSWGWNISASKAGEANVKVVIRTVCLDAGINVAENERSFERKLTVREDYPKLIVELLKEHAEKIVGAIIAVLGGAIAWLKRKKIRDLYSKLWKKPSSMKDMDISKLAETRADTQQPDSTSGAEKSTNEPPKGPADAR